MKKITIIAVAAFQLFFGVSEQRTVTLPFYLANMARFVVVLPPLVPVKMLPKTSMPLKRTTCASG